MKQAPQLPPGSRLLDSHCHLEEERFAADRPAVLERAAAAGVTRMVTIGASGGMGANEEALLLAERESAVFATVGIHPHEARLVDEPVLARLEEMARHPRVVAVGETGLDYYYDNSPREAQQAAFRRFVHLARRLSLPLVVHLRDATDDALAILREEKAAEVGGVIHCFSGDRSAARAFLDLGFHLSFSGIVTFKNADELRAAAAMVPEDRFLVETDAPYLAPVPFRGRRNEPAYVVCTAAAVAEVRHAPLGDVAAQTTRNAERLFHLPEPT